MSEICTVCFRGGLQPETSIALANGYRHNPQCPPLGDGDYWPFERHQFPIGEVYYRDSDHTYFTAVNPKTQGRGDEKATVAYTGVQEAQIGSPSGIGGHAESGVPDALADWFARVGPNWRDKRDAKGDVGSFTHKVVECRIRGDHQSEGELYDTWASSIIEAAEPYLQAVDRLFVDHVFEPIAIERVVYSKEHGYAGRFDAGCRWVESVPDPLQRLDAEPLGWKPGDTFLGDYKTSGFISRKYHHQLRLYEVASEECGVGSWDHLAIFQFCADGTYKVLPVRSTPDAALACLFLYWEGKETDKLTRADERVLVAA